MHDSNAVNCFLMLPSSGCTQILPTPSEISMDATSAEFGSQRAADILAVVGSEKDRLGVPGGCELYLQSSGLPPLVL